jgi:hypothetical protein
MQPDELTPPEQPFKPTMAGNVIAKRLLLSMYLVREEPYRTLLQDYLRQAKEHAARVQAEGLLCLDDNGPFHSKLRDLLTACVRENLRDFSERWGWGDWGFPLAEVARQFDSKEFTDDVLDTMRKEGWEVD